MSATLQSVIVLLIVATATIYATLKFMPAAWRRSVATRVAHWATRSGLSDTAVRRVEAKLASGGACGSCDSCKACATPMAREEVGSFRRIPIRRAS